ncbi:hypothetical protein CLV84_0194 [Neolewinella xylanilytica]|uniref:Uncharacterized protein n=1 Tax=Neolewinella xylanilytica TaxID=1514080 RepID=A0A2S6I716_9BACT|nr:hypothetical protein [Neolewinella xylanilytica]PPK87257.1 hypothetical protein CLV84_0194 [Neolewinella xylanilytica]
MPVVNATEAKHMGNYARLVTLFIAFFAVACASEETGSATPIDGPETVSVDPDKTGFAERTPADSTAENALALEPGLYVAEGSDCRNPANAGYRVWTGRGLEGSATDDCTFEVVSVDGETYTGRQSCANTSDGNPSPVEITIEILEPSSFILTEADETVHLTLCPEGVAPAWVAEKLVDE